MESSSGTNSFSTKATFSGLSSEDQATVDRCCDQFEEAYQTRRPLSIETVLREVPERLRPYAMREVVAIEVEFRLRQGEVVPWSDYAARFPDLDHDWFLSLTKGRAGHPPREVTQPALRMLTSLFETRAEQTSEASAHSEFDRPPRPVGIPESGMRVLGEYELIRELGRGGMGRVYLARHRRMNREVAIKTLSTDLMQQPTAIRRFRREVQAAARLIHPNIVTAYDAGEQDGIHYLVMEYVQGEDLRSLVAREGPLPVERAAQYIQQAATGLGRAHQLGIVHRDVKPSNLLLDKQGIIKVLDLGLARMDERMTPDEGDLTKSHTLLGTVAFMAPEQGLGAAHVDGRADIYSLGCTLHYLLVGKPPLEGNTLVDTIVAHQTRPVPPMRVSRAEIPAELDAVFQSMLAKEPQGRPATMEQVVLDLAAALRPAPRIQPSPRPASPRQSQPATPEIQSIDAPPAPDLLAAAMTPTTKTSPATTKKPLVKKPTQKTPPQKTPLAIRSTTPPSENQPTFSASPQPGISESEQANLVRVATGTTASPLATSNVKLAKGQAWQQIGRIRGQRYLLPSGMIGGLLLIGIISLFFWPRQQEKPISRPNQADATKNGVPRPPHFSSPAHSGMAQSAQQAWSAYYGLENPYYYNSLQMKFMLIPPGRYNQGISESEHQDWLRLNELAGLSSPPAALPSVEQSIEHAFWLARRETSVAEFRQFVEATGFITEAERTGRGWGMVAGQWRTGPAFSWKNAGEFQLQDDFPACSLSWNDATAFCRWLTERELAQTGSKVVYRLPTEKEWEYACRAGSQTPWSHGNQLEQLRLYAWYADNAQDRLHPVESLLPNGFGLFGMLGNEAEWCQDTFPNHSHPQRGGNFGDDASHVSCAARRISPADTTARGSFRVLGQWQQN